LTIKQGIEGHGQHCKFVITDDGCPPGGAPRLLAVARLEALLPPPLDVFLVEDRGDVAIVYSAHPKWRRDAPNCRFGRTVVHGPLAVVGRRGSRFESLSSPERAAAFALLSRSEARADGPAAYSLRARDEAAARYLASLPAAANDGAAKALAEEAFRAGWSALAGHVRAIADGLIGDDVPPGEVLGHVYLALLYLSERPS
jgi:hypothetical protein